MKGDAFRIMLHTRAVQKRLCSVSPSLSTSVLISSNNLITLILLGENKVSDRVTKLKFQEHEAFSLCWLYEGLDERDDWLTL